jgi:hypothetical protein
MFSKKGWPRCFNSGPFSAHHCLCLPITVIGGIVRCSNCATRDLSTASSSCASLCLVLPTSSFYEVRNPLTRWTLGLWDKTFLVFFCFTGHFSLLSFAGSSLSNSKVMHLRVHLLLLFSPSSTPQGISSIFRNWYFYSKSCSSLGKSRHRAVWTLISHFIKHINTHPWFKVNVFFIGEVHSFYSLKMYSM